MWIKGWEFFEPQCMYRVGRKNLTKSISYIFCCLVNYLEHLIEYAMTYIVYWWHWQWHKRDVSNCSVLRVSWRVKEMSGISQSLSRGHSVLHVTALLMLLHHWCGCLVLFNDIYVECCELALTCSWNTYFDDFSIQKVH